MSRGASSSPSRFRTRFCATIALALRGDHLADIAVLREQPAVFGTDSRYRSAAAPALDSDPDLPVVSIGDR
ncbi:hypothetical protein [Mycolicibacterium gadium]|uniref:hypothetical protein n=1 Tax=Mycolicibacterium gadium TaxID=1794 RepID=UPI002FDE360C